MLGHQQVLQHRHFPEQANILESPCQSGAVDQVRTTEHLVVEPTGEAFRRNEIGRLERFPKHFDDVGFLATGIEFDLATGGFVEPGQAVEHRGLARAVGADQGEDRVAFDLQADVTQGLDAAEVHHQFLYREYDFTHDVFLS
ncbi:hypothetical protein D3C84_898620 [compost metagenome]